MPMASGAKLKIGSYCSGNKAGYKNHRYTQIEDTDRHRFIGPAKSPDNIAQSVSDTGCEG